MATNAELIAAARSLQARTSAVPIPAFYGSPDQTPRGTVPVNRKAFDDVLTVLSSLNSVSTVIIDGASPNAVAQLTLALAGDATLIVLTGTFTLAAPLPVRKGWRRIYLMDATLNSTLTEAGRGMFELEAGTFLDIASRNSDVNLTGTGGGNAVFRAASEDFTLQIDGGAYAGPFKSDITYSGTNVRCIKVVAPQAEALLPANLFNMGFTGSGTGEQFTDTGAPRLVVNSMVDCSVTSRYLAVKSVGGSGLSFTGGSIAVTHHATVLGLVINQAPTDPSGSLIFSNLTADRIVVNATYPGGLGAVVGLTAGAIEVNSFFYSGTAGVGTTVNLNWVGSHVAYLQTFTPTGVFHVNFDGQNEVIHVNNATDVNVSLASRWVLAGDLVNILGTINITATFVSDLEVFPNSPGPHTYNANFVDSCLLNGTSRFLPGPQGSQMGISNTRLQAVEIGPGMSLVQMANINMDGYALSGAGPGTESPVRGTNCVVGTAVGASPANSVTLRASAGVAGANAVITDP